MNIEQLRYIIEVANTKSIALASQKMYLTQPAISQSITNLEKELGFKIFTRSRRGAFPTDEGEVLIKKAAEVISKLEELHMQVQTYNTQADEKIKISCGQFMMPVALKALIQFKKKYPGIKVELFQKPDPEVFNDLLNGTSDFGFVTLLNMEEYAEKFHFEEILEGKIQALVSKNSPLANHDLLTIREIQDQLFVFFSGPAYMKVALSLFPNPIKISFTSNDFEVLKETISRNLAISLSIDFYMKDDKYVKSGDIIPIDLITKDNVPLKYGWAKSKIQNLSKNSIKFLECLKMNSH